MHCVHCVNISPCKDAFTSKCQVAIQLHLQWRRRPLLAPQPQQKYIVVVLLTPLALQIPFSPPIGHARFCKGQLTWKFCWVMFTLGSSCKHPCRITSPGGHGCVQKGRLPWKFCCVMFTLGSSWKHPCRITSPGSHGCVKKDDDLDEVAKDASNVSKMRLTCPRCV
jgi:hypothetical protein